MLSGIGSHCGYSSYLQNQAMGRADPSEMFNTTDTDGSGGISQTELEDWVSTISENTQTSIDASGALDEFDLDENGELSSTELKSFLTANSIEAPSGADKAAGTASSGSSSGGSSSGGSSSVISEYDTNGDGVLSSEELQAYLDDVEENSSAPNMREAISNYAMNFMNSNPSNARDAFMNPGGTGAYSPIDIEG